MLVLLCMHKNLFQSGTNASAKELVLTPDVCAVSRQCQFRQMGTHFSFVPFGGLREHCWVALFCGVIMASRRGGGADLVTSVNVKASGQGKECGASCETHDYASNFSSTEICGFCGRLQDGRAGWGRRGRERRRWADRLWISTDNLDNINDIKD